MPITDFQDVSTTKKTLTIEVPGERVSEALAEVARGYRSKAAIPGFRKGHVPEKVVRQRFAAEIRQDALDRLLPQELFGALREKGLEPVVSPSVEDLHFEDGQPLRFKATVEVRPPIELGVYRGLAIPTLPTEPSEAEMDKALADLREPAAQYLPVEGRAALRGDFVVADIKGSFPNGDGEPFENPKAFLELGNERNFQEINDLVPGLERGRTVEFDHVFEADFPNPDMAGKTIHYSFELVEIKEKKLPDLDDEFAKSSGMAETAEELRGKVREGLTRHKQDHARQAARRAILDQLRASHTFEIPEGLVEEELEQTLRRTAAEIAGQGVDLSKVGIDWDKLRDEAREGSERRVAERLILDAIVAKESIEATDTELDAEIRRLARGLQKDPVEFKHDLSHRGLLDELRSDIKRAKVMAELVGSSRTE